jgi:MAP3K TRAFs-binding domain/Caspase domain
MDSKISTNQGKKKALIIAISEYDNLPKEKQLPFCKNDGEAIYEILQKQGYEILDNWKLIGTVTSNQIKKAIFDFFRKQAESRDTLLFYFSGHGIPDGHGGHYLAPSDIEVDMPDYYGFRFSDLQDQANKSLAKKIITILDCCFSGAAGVKGNEDDVAKSARSDMERAFQEGDGKCVLASSLADQVSYKMEGEPYSLFTYCLLEGLKGGNGEAVNLEGYVTPYTLGNYVYYRITSEDRRQKPITKTEMSGDIELAHYPQLVEKQEKELLDDYYYKSLNRPLCFVLMPFGQKRDISGVLINFDSVYKELIAPSIEKAGLQPLRADEELTGGIIHKPMFERLILCEYAVADLTTANANVFYELGVRHAVRPWSTVLVYAESGGRLPFDLSLMRALPYAINSEGVIEDNNAETVKAALVKRLEEAKRAQSAGIDSPIFQLVEGYPNIDHTKTDVFRDRVAYSKQLKQKLATARKQGIDAIRALEKQELGNNIGDVEAGVIVDLFLSYRAVKGWQDMINLVDRMPPPLAATAMIQEQLALALNRQASQVNEPERTILRERAERVLLDLLEKRGPHPETYGILGRIYKDQWEEAVKAGEDDDFAARGLLKKAIEAYFKGFEADWRDAYPGINAATLMEISDPPDPRRNDLLPVVTYSVERKIASGKPDYWDYATRLELAVLKKDEDLAKSAVSAALTSVREAFEPETTARNLKIIREARERRKEPSLAWARQVEERLDSAAARIISKHSDSA